LFWQTFFPSDKEAYLSTEKILPRHLLKIPLEGQENEVTVHLARAWNQTK